MNSDLIDSNPKSATTETNKVKVIFEFAVLKPKLTIYRGVQSADGSYRMEKRGAAAKSFRPFMWCGSEAGLHQHRQAVEFYCRNAKLTTKSQQLKSCRSSKLATNLMTI